MGYQIEVTALEPQPAAVVRDQVTVDAPTLHHGHETERDGHDPEHRRHE